MSFQINYKSGDCDIDVFYPYEGWNSNDPAYPADESDLKVRQLITNFISNKKNGKKFKALYEEFREDLNDLLLQGVEWFLESRGELEVEDQRGNIIYTNRDYEFLNENPSTMQMIPNCIDKEFCLVKVWENKRCKVIYEHANNNEFNISLLKYLNGKLYYDGEEFENTGSEGMSSYWEIYIEGVMVYGCGVNTYSIE